MTELLIVLGILAVLATVTVLLLNPTEFTAQSRDSRRISDLKNLDAAISLSRNSLYETLTDNTQVNVVYTSLPDLNSDGLCTEYSLPPLGGSWQYRCRASADNLRKVDGNGWIPINFTSVSTNPLTVLPVDPVNNQDNHYTYSWDASSRATIAAKLESDKYLTSYANNAQGDGGNDDVAFETWPIAYVSGQGGTFLGQVASGLDDAYDDGTNFYGTSTDIWLGSNGTYTNKAGFRFQNVTVPQGVTVTSARMQLRRSNMTTQVYTTIYGVDVGDTTSWSVSNNPKNAVVTSGGVNWDPGSSWSDWTYTPDLTNLAQEVICRSDWASGNDMSFVIWDRLVGTGTRSARAYEYAPADAAKVEINYSGTAYSDCAGFANAAPTSPTTLYTGYPSAQSGSSNPTNFAYSTPIFSAIYNDPDAGDTANKYRVQITLASDTGYASPVWDSGSSGTSFSSSCNRDARCEDIPYVGTTLLARSQNYIWRIKYWDSATNEGAWSANGTIGMGSGALTARFYVVDKTIEGCLFDNSPAWDTRHDSTGSGVCNLTSTTTTVGDNSSITRLSRSFFPFDTSGIPDTDAVSASSLKLWSSGVADNDNDGNDFLSVFKSYQASPTALQVGDYDACGDSIGYSPSGPYPTEGSDRIDLNNVSTSQYTSFSLNATGSSWVSTAGRTLLCVREGHDSLDSSPAGSVYADVYAADYGIVGRRPYLEATYFQPGPSGYALQFDGINDYVRVPDSVSLGVTNAITMEAWMKLASVGNAADFRTIIGKSIQGGGDVGGYGILSSENQTGIGFYFTKDTGASWALPNIGGGEFYPVTSGTWYHIVATYDRTQNLMSLYVNGNLVAGPESADGSAIGTTTKPLYTGGDPENNSPGTAEFSGVIDEVRIYNRALLTTEAREHYLGTFTNETGLMGLWHFDENSGITTADASGNGNNGTLFNGVQWVTP